MKNTSRIIIFLLVASSVLPCRAKQINDLRQAAINYVVADGPQAMGMKEISSGQQKGLIVTVEKPQSNDKAMYWVTFEESTPVYAGKPRPQEKQNLLHALRIIGPEFRGVYNERLSDEEFQALSALKSPRDILVREPIAQAIIKEKVLPGIARELQEGQFFARETEAHYFIFDFSTMSNRGLTGVTVLVDEDGTVITKYEHIAPDDLAANKPNEKTTGTSTES